MVLFTYEMKEFQKVRIMEGDVHWTGNLGIIFKELQNLTPRFDFIAPYECYKTSGTGYPWQTRTNYIPIEDAWFTIIFMYGVSMRLANATHQLLKYKLQNQKQIFDCERK